jgi:hypothetical protein
MKKYIIFVLLALVAANYAYPIKSFAGGGQKADNGDTPAQEPLPSLPPCGGSC